jgi:hypothetical protein
MPMNSGVFILKYTKILRLLSHEIFTFLGAVEEMYFAFSAFLNIVLFS